MILAACASTFKPVHHECNSTMGRCIPGAARTERSVFGGRISLEKRRLALGIGRKRVLLRWVVRNGRLEVSARALENRQPSLKRWSSQSSASPSKPSRWDLINDRYSPKDQPKPRRVQPKTTADDDAPDAGIHKELEKDGELVEFVQEERPEPGLREAGEIILRKAKQKAQSVRKRLREVDLRTLISTTVDGTRTTPLPPFTGSLIAGIGLVFACGLLVDMLLWRMSRGPGTMSNVGSGVLSSGAAGEGGTDSLRGARTPSVLSALLDGDLGRKESVEWVNMVIGKLWNLYRRGLENWLVSLLQPIIDDLEKPDYVEKVQVKQFFLGDEPMSVRTVERRTSRRADDLQYHIGVRYTGGARLLLLITLKWGIIPLTIPVGVRGLDVDAEVWVKFRMIPTDPWVGQATWAFVTLPKIKLALAPFRLVNLMAIPFLSIFLAKLLTEDLPQLFVRPNQNVVDFLQGKEAIGPVNKDFKDGLFLDGTSFFNGELSVTLIESRKLSYIPYLKTDPYVIFVLGEQVLRSKRNSQTSVVGAPGSPVWNQDFKLLVVDQKTQHLSLTVHDTIGFTSYPVGSADIDLRTLQDTVPVDRKLVLKSGWGPFPKRFAGEIVLRLTYKAYIDEDGQEIPVGPGDGLYTHGTSSHELGAIGAEQVQEVATFFKEEAGKVAEFFQEKDLAREMLSSLNAVTSSKEIEEVLPLLLPREEGESGTQEQIPMKIDTVAENGVLQKDVPKLIVKKTDSTNGVTPPSKDQENQVMVQKQEGDDEPAKLMPSGTTSKDNSGLLWLAAVTGLVLLVALDLNLTNVLNP